MRVQVPYDEPIYDKTMNDEFEFPGDHFPLDVTYSMPVQLRGTYQNPSKEETPSEDNQKENMNKEHT